MKKLLIIGILIILFIAVSYYFEKNIVDLKCPNIKIVPTVDKDFKNKAATEFNLPSGKYVVVIDATKDKDIDGVTKFKKAKVRYSIQIPQSNVNIEREEEINLNVGPVNYVREEFNISKKSNGTLKTEIVDPIDENIYIKILPAGCFNSI